MHTHTRHHHSLQVERRQPRHVPPSVTSGAHPGRRPLEGHSPCDKTHSVSNVTGPDLRMDHTMGCKRKAHETGKCDISLKVESLETSHVLKRLHNRCPSIRSDPIIPAPRPTCSHTLPTHPCHHPHHGHSPQVEQRQPRHVPKGLCDGCPALSSECVTPAPTHAQAHTHSHTAHTRTCTLTLVIITHLRLSVVSPGRWPRPRPTDLTASPPPPNPP